MDKNRKDAYTTGIIGVLIFFVLGLMALNTGWNMSGQLLGVFATVFGILGVGSFFKPDIFGPILSQIIENFKDKENHTNIQKQKHSRNSPQVQAKGPVNIYYQDSQKENKKDE